LVVVLAPFAWLLISSVAAPVDLLRRPLQWIPSHIGFDRFAQLTFGSSPDDTAQGFRSAVVNSMVIASTVTVVSLVAGTLAAYAFARLRFPGRGWLVLAFMATYMLPPIALILPLYQIMNLLHLRDTTGNRRFWPVKCGRIDIELAREWRDQLFAEAIDAFSKREQWWLSRDIETLAEDEQQQRMVEDVWEQKAIDLIHEARSNPFKGGSWVTIKELLDAVMPNSDNREERLQKRAGRVLRKHRGSKRQLPRGRKPEGWPLRGFHWEPYQ